MDSINTKFPKGDRWPQRNLLGERLGERFLRMKESIFDRRCRFHDLSCVAPPERKPHAPIIQFYSAVDNIGNYLPVLGIHRMLCQDTDTWNIHDHHIDFEFVNQNYRYAIIGGAGLLHQSFDPFWDKFLHACRLPFVIWGIGVCLPHDGRQQGVDKQRVRQVAEKCELINVRDNLTAEYYQLKQAHVSLCPAVVEVARFKKHVNPNGRKVLFAHHPELVSQRELDGQVAVTRDLGFEYQVTDNIQKKNLGISDIIRQSYCQSRVVIASRLHGAIIAYALGIPYIVFPKDEKLRAFQKAYGNGLHASNIDEIKQLLECPKICDVKPTKMEPVFDFGKQVCQKLVAHGLKAGERC